MTDKEIQDTISAAAQSLGEHFDGVLILATFRRDNLNTALKSSISGNFYTAKGMAEKFLDDDRARDIAHAILTQSNP